MAWSDAFENFSSKKGIQVPVLTSDGVSFLLELSFDTSACDLKMFVNRMIIRKCRMHAWTGRKDVGAFVR